MASEQIQEICDDIRKKGYVKVDDPAIGTCVESMLRNGFFLKDSRAVETLRTVIFDKEHVRTVIERLVHKPTWAFFRAFGQTPDYQCFLYSDNPKKPTDEVRGLVIYLCSKQTIIGFGKESHVHQIEAKEWSRIGNLAVPGGKFEELGIHEVQEELENGGYILVHPQIGWKIFRGKVAFAAIMIPEEAESWHKMPFWKTQDLIEKMRGMSENFETFCTNITWDEPKENP